MSQQFSKIYKTWSDLELFRLLQNKSDYQQEAVEAAEAEMNSRKLSEPELRCCWSSFKGIYLPSGYSDQQPKPGKPISVKNLLVIKRRL